MLLIFFFCIFGDWLFLVEIRLRKAHTPISLVVDNYVMGKVLEEAPPHFCILHTHSDAL